MAWKTTTAPQLTKVDNLQRDFQHFLDKEWSTHQTSFESFLEKEWPLVKRGFRDLLHSEKREFIIDDEGTPEIP